MRIGAIGLLAGVLACGAGPSRPSSAARREGARASAHPAARSRTAPLEAAPGPLIGDYAVHYDGVGKLTVEATLDRPGGRFTIERGAEKFVERFEVAEAASSSPGGEAWTRGARDGRSFVAPPCAAGRCRIRYHFSLREAAARIDDLDVASEEGALVEAPPSTWLLAPEKADAAARVRFRVTTTDDTAFRTGVFRSREAPGAWDIALGDLWTSPYSVFGPLRVHPVEQGAHIEVAVAPGRLEVTDDQLVAWTRDCARAVVTYFGRFPVPELLVVLVPSGGRWVGGGKTLSGGGSAIFVRVGERATVQALREDWVLVHEMTHLAFPSVSREHDWAEEGLATYVEPFARARAGLVSVEDAWRGLVEGLPNGLPGPGDRGLDQTPTWGRTYWGGALFYLLADIELRKRTNLARGLEHALRGILAEGGNNARRWSLEDAFAAGDRATGAFVLGELHDAMGRSPHPVDLADLWRQLGIVRERGTVRFDDGAPLAAVRRAITTGETQK